MRPSLTAYLCLPALFASAVLAADDVPSQPAIRPPEEEVITTVAAAFARWPDLATDTQAVRLEGVVTGVMPTGAFRMHDGELGIYVAKSATGQQLSAGDRIAVSGVLRKGGFSPWIALHTLTRHGRAPFPDAKPAPYEVLASGAADNQWVEIEGVVRAVLVPEPRDFVVLDLGMSGGNLRVLLNYEPGRNFNSLIDASVRIRGVAAVNVNAQKHVVEPSFRVPSSSQIHVLRAGQPDAFAQPPVPVKRLMRFSPGVSQRHRVRTSGIVTRRLSDHTLFLRDAEDGLKVETALPLTARAGDRVDVAGFPAVIEGMAVLQHAICRVIASGTAPAPAAPSMDLLLSGTHNSDLVSIQARLVDSVVAGANITLIFQAGDQLFKGLLGVGANTPVTLPPKNSVVNVTGICAINELEDLWFYQPSSFLLLIAELNDLRLIQAPPWWTPERLGRALAITGLVLLAAVGWVWALRRQIERKRAVIEQQARHAAALEERSRIARELHDTLEQGLTGLSLQMKAMETDLGLAPHPVRSRLQFARQMLRQSRALARNAIRELRAETTPGRLEGLVDGLKRIADSWNHSGAITINYRVTGDVRALPLRIEHHLLGIGTEAITNAVKHGRAERIDADVIFGRQELVVRIKDNGVGFEPAHHLEHASGCFGLLGMRERAREVRGDIRIESEPGRGTEVLVSAPIEEPAVMAVSADSANASLGIARTSPATVIATVAAACPSPR